MRFVALLLLWVCFVPFAVVHGADGYDGTPYPYETLVTQTGDYFVVIEVASTFTAETDLCNDTADFWCAGPGDGGNFTDSVLWLYADDGSQITANDDDPRTNGLSYHSYISVQLEAGVYRLRAGRFTCHDGSCLWPQDPFPVGGSYQLLTTAALLLDPNPPVVNPSPIPSILPTPEPSPEPSVEPSPTQTPEPSAPSPSVAPTPTPEPSVEPTPEPSPTTQPTPTAPPPTPEPTPDPTPEPTEPPPTVAPTQEPTNEPPPNPTATPQPTPEGTVEPTAPPPPAPSPDPSPVPSPELPQPALPDVGAAVEQVAAAAVEAVSESVAAIGGGIADIAAIGEIGKDLDSAEKEEAQPMAVVVISSQIASITAAAASAARSGGSTPSGGNLGGGGGGGADAPKTRKTSSRKELK